MIPLLEVAGGAFRERFASRGLKLQFSLPDSITVFGDRDRLMQLFNNLLENSLRYTDSGGSLKISAGQHDKTVRLTLPTVRQVSVTSSYKNYLNVFIAPKVPQPRQRWFQAGAGDLPEHC